MKVLMKEIEMIAYFKDDTYPKPLRFRLESEDSVRRVVPIDKVCFVKEDKKAGNKMFVYDCQGLIGNTLLLFEIIYEVDKCKWFLYKI